MNGKQDLQVCYVRLYLSKHTNCPETRSLSGCHTSAQRCVKQTEPLLQDCLWSPSETPGGQQKTLVSTRLRRSGPVLSPILTYCRGSSQDTIQTADKSFQEKQWSLLIRTNKASPETSLCSSRSNGKLRLQHHSRTKLQLKAKDRSNANMQNCVCWHQDIL